MSNNFRVSVSGIAKIASSFFLATALSSATPAQITKTKDGYLMRVRYTAGQVIKFDTVNAVDNKGTGAPPVSITVPLTLRVLSVKKGLASIVVVTGMARMGKEDLPGIKSETIKLTLDSHNSGSSSSPGIGPKMPEHPVKVGSHWQSIVPMTFGGVQKNLEGVYTFAGLKTVAGQQVAVVNYTLTGAATGTGTMLMLTKDGSLYSNDMRVSLGGIDRVRSVVKRRP